VAQARAAGWTRSSIRHAVAAGDLIVPRRGILAVALRPAGQSWRERRDEHLQAAAAAVLSRPGARASHCSAALLMNVPVLEVPQVPCLTTPPRHSGDVPNVHLHRTRIARGDAGRIGRLRVTMPARTVVDIARERGEVAGVVTADGVLRRELITADELRAVAESAAGRPGVEAARSVALLADRRAESALESRSRLAMRALRLCAPELQPEIFVDDRFVGRVDFYWDEFGVVGEADGWGKYDAGWAQVRAEKQRQERLEQAGLVVVRWGSDELSEFAAVAARLRRAFARGSRLPRSERRWTVRAASNPLRAAG
jgi:very-short-patch-repair endonuclease